MPWVILILAGAGAFWLWHKWQTQASQSPLGPVVWRPAPTPTPPPQSQTTPGVVPSQIDDAGATLVLLTPGYMGTIKFVSSSSTQPGRDGPPHQALDVQAIGGAILKVESSNTNVLFGQDGSPTTSGVALGQPLLQGTTRLTFHWKDNSGAAQTTTFDVVAT